MVDEAFMLFLGGYQRRLTPEWSLFGGWRPANWSYPWDDLCFFSAREPTRKLFAMMPLCSGHVFTKTGMLDANTSTNISWILRKLLHGSAIIPSSNSKIFAHPFCCSSSSGNTSSGWGKTKKTLSGILNEARPPGFWQQQEDVTC